MFFMYLRGKVRFEIKRVPCGEWYTDGRMYVCMYVMENRMT